MGHPPYRPPLPQHVVSDRGFHNKAALAIVAKLMLETVCRLFSGIYAEGWEIGGNLHESTGFLAPYGFQGDAVDFPKVSASIAQRLLNGENLDPRCVNDVLSSDICDRLERLIANRKRWWPFMTDAEINEGMKWSEFQRRHAPEIDSIWRPARELKYMLMDVIREVDRPISADDYSKRFEAIWRTRTSEHPRDYFNREELIKSRCKEEQRLAFEAFKGTHKWESLEKIRTRSTQLRSARDVGACLD